MKIMWRWSTVDGNYYASIAKKYARNGVAGHYIRVFYDNNVKFFEVMHGCTCIAEYKTLYAAKVRANNCIRLSVSQHELCIDAFNKI